MTTVPHRHEIRLAGDVHIPVEYAGVRDDTTGIVTLGRCEIAEAAYARAAYYGYPRHTINDMAQEYRSGHNAASRAMAEFRRDRLAEAAEESKRRDPFPEGGPDDPVIRFSDSGASVAQIEHAAETLWNDYLGTIPDELRHECRGWSSIPEEMRNAYRQRVHQVARALVPAGYTILARTRVPDGARARVALCYVGLSGYPSIAWAREELLDVARTVWGVDDAELLALGHEEIARRARTVKQTGRG